MIPYILINILMRPLNRGDAEGLRNAARILAEFEGEVIKIKGEPVRIPGVWVEKETLNPFFAYLNEGSTDHVRDLTFDLCPATVEDVQKSKRSQ